MGGSLEPPDGSDMIFVAGAPGSRWSAVAHALSYAEPVNLSDVTLERAERGRPQVHHFGNYFGPGMEFGHRFDELGTLPREDLVREFAAPYQRPGGVRILKSHLFCRHLDRLRELFPAAGLVLVHRPDDECFSWWQQAGGLSITFPDYSWYVDRGMERQIAEDNGALQSFARRHGLAMQRHRSMGPILRPLRLRYSDDRILSQSRTAFERTFGIGGGTLAEVRQSLDSAARVARIAVVPRAQAGT